MSDAVMKEEYDFSKGEVGKYFKKFIPPMSHWYCTGCSVSGWMGASTDNPMICRCGGEIVIEKTTGLRYKVTFTTVDHEYLRSCSEKFPWKHLTDVEWDALPWGDPIANDLDRERPALSQFEKLKEWAESHEHPFKDVSYRVVRVVEYAVDPNKE